MPSARSPAWIPVLLAVALAGALALLVLREGAGTEGDGRRDADEVLRLRREVARLEADLERAREAAAPRLEPAPTPPTVVRNDGPPAPTAPGTPGASAAGAAGAGAAGPAGAEAPSAADGGAAALAALPPTEAGVLALLRHLEAARQAQPDVALVADRDAFLARLARRVPAGPVLEDPPPDADLEDGTTVLLSEGVHDYAAFANAHRGRFPADVVFRGAGMDRTLLVLHEVGATGEMRGLAFEDLTLDLRGHYLADVRGDEPISLRFLRTRLLGFDSGPGGAVVLAARTAAVQAEASRFEAGFGDRPGEGSLFHVRGPFLVRFDDCVLSGPMKSLYEKSPMAAYLFSGCRFERMHPDRRRDLETPDPNVRLEGCTVEYEEVGPDPLVPRSLGEINPAWR